MTNTVEELNKLSEVIDTLTKAVQVATDDYNENLDSVDTEHLENENQKFALALFHLAHEGSEFCDAIHQMKSLINQELRENGVDVKPDMNEMLRALLG